MSSLSRTCGKFTTESSVVNTIQHELNTWGGKNKPGRQHHVLSFHTLEKMERFREGGRKSSFLENQTLWVTRFQAQRVAIRARTHPAHLFPPGGQSNLTIVILHRLHITGPSLLSRERVTVLYSWSPYALLSCISHVAEVTNELNPLLCVEDPSHRNL